MISFDEWLKNKGQPASNFLRREAFEAGQESQQQKIDDLNNQLLMLQNRIDDALNEIYKEKSKAECDGHSKDVSDFIFGFGYDLHLILKGEIE